jgi:hypothetical protein
MCIRPPQVEAVEAAAPGMAETVEAAVALEIDWNVLGDWLPTLGTIISGLQLDAFVSYAETSGVVAQHSLDTYRGYLLGQPLPNGASIQHPSGNLAKGAELNEKGYLDYFLENPVSYAEAVEKGVKARDLKDMLPTAKKARRAKDGTLYLIIPFRHGTPGTVGLHPMPARIHAMALELYRSRVKAGHMEMSGTGYMVKRHSYNWGSKLTVQQIQDAGLPFKAQNRYQGMYKFGNARHTSYITFRVMSQKSAGWVVPARPGIWAARTAVQVALEDGKDLLTNAAMDDIMRICGL